MDANKSTFPVSQTFSMSIKKMRGLRTSPKFSSYGFLLNSQMTIDLRGAFLGFPIWNSDSDTPKQVTPLPNYVAFDGYYRGPAIRTPSTQSLRLRPPAPKVSLMGSTAGSNVSQIGIVTLAVRCWPWTPEK